MVCGQVGFFSAPLLTRKLRFALASHSPRARLAFASFCLKYAKNCASSAGYLPPDAFFWWSTQEKPKEAKEGSGEICGPNYTRNITTVSFSEWKLNLFGADSNHKLCKCPRTCLIKSLWCTDLYSKEQFSIAFFLPRVLMYQKRQISILMGYKTTRPKTRHWEWLWRHFRTSSFVKNRFLSHFLIVS